MMSPKCSIVEDNGKLMLIALHTLSATAAIFSGVRTGFGFSHFGLSMRTDEKDKINYLLNEISTSYKKTLDGGSNLFDQIVCTLHY